MADNCHGYELWCIGSHFESHFHCIFSQRLSSLIVLLFCLLFLGSAQQHDSPGAHQVPPTGMALVWDLVRQPLQEKCQDDRPGEDIVNSSSLHWAPSAGVNDKPWSEVVWATQIKKKQHVREQTHVIRFTERVTTMSPDAFKTVSRQGLMQEVIKC